MTSEREAWLARAASPSQMLRASADIAAAVGRPAVAEFWRDMADDAESVGQSLYRHWANQAADYASKLRGEQTLDKMWRCTPPGTLTDTAVRDLGDGHWSVEG